MQYYHATHHGFLNKTVILGIGHGSLTLYEKAKGFPPGVIAGGSPLDKSTSGVKFRTFVPLWNILQVTTNSYGPHGGFLQIRVIAPEGLNAMFQFHQALTMIFLKNRTFWLSAMLTTNVQRLVRLLRVISQVASSAGLGTSGLDIQPDSSARCFQRSTADIPLELLAKIQLLQHTLARTRLNAGSSNDLAVASSVASAICHAVIHGRLLYAASDFASIMATGFSAADIALPPPPHIASTEWDKLWFGDVAHMNAAHDAILRARDAVTLPLGVVSTMTAAIPRPVGGLVSRNWSGVRSFDLVQAIPWALAHAQPMLVPPGARTARTTLRLPARRVSLRVTLTDIVLTSPDSIPLATVPLRALHAVTLDATAPGLAITVGIPEHAAPTLAASGETGAPLSTRTTVLCLAGAACSVAAATIQQAAGALLGEGVALLNSPLAWAPGLAAQPTLWQPRSSEAPALATKQLDLRGALSVMTCQHCGAPRDAALSRKVLGHTDGAGGRFVQTALRLCGSATCGCHLHTANDPAWVDAAVRARALPPSSNIMPVSEVRSQFTSDTPGLPGVSLDVDLGTITALHDAGHGAYADWAPNVLARYPVLLLDADAVVPHAEAIIPALSAGAFATPASTDGVASAYLARAPAAGEQPGAWAVLAASAAATAVGAVQDGEEAAAAAVSSQIRDLASAVADAAGVIPNPDDATPATPGTTPFGSPGFMPDAQQRQQRRTSHGSSEGDEDVASDEGESCPAHERTASYRSPGARDGGSSNMSAALQARADEGVDEVLDSVTLAGEAAAVSLMRAGTAWLAAPQMTLEVTGTHVLVVMHTVLTVRTPSAALCWQHKAVLTAVPLLTLSAVGQGWLAALHVQSGASCSVHRLPTLELHCAMPHVLSIPAAGADSPGAGQVVVRPMCLRVAVLPGVTPSMGCVPHTLVPALQGAPTREADASGVWHSAQASGDVLQHVPATTAGAQLARWLSTCAGACTAAALSHALPAQLLWLGPHSAGPGLQPRAASRAALPATADAGQLQDLVWLRVREALGAYSPHCIAALNRHARGSQGNGNALHELDFAPPVLPASVAAAVALTGTPRMLVRCTVQAVRVAQPAMSEHLVYWPPRSDSLLRNAGHCECSADVRAVGAVPVHAAQGFATDPMPALFKLAGNDGQQLSGGNDDAVPDDGSAVPGGQLLAIPDISGTFKHAIDAVKSWAGPSVPSVAPGMAAGSGTTGQASSAATPAWAPSAAEPAHAQSDATPEHTLARWLAFSMNSAVREPDAVDVPALPLHPAVSTAPPAWPGMATQALYTARTNAALVVLPIGFTVPAWGQAVWEALSPEVQASVVSACSKAAGAEDTASLGATDGLAPHLVLAAAMLPVGVLPPGAAGAVQGVVATASRAAQGAVAAALAGVPDLPETALSASASAASAGAMAALATQPVKQLEAAAAVYGGDPLHRTTMPEYAGSSAQHMLCASFQDVEGGARALHVHEFLPDEVAPGWAEVAKGAAAALAGVSAVSAVTPAMPVPPVLAPEASCLGLSAALHAVAAASATLATESIRLRLSRGSKLLQASTAPADTRASFAAVKAAWAALAAVRLAYCPGYQDGELPDTPSAAPVGVSPRRPKQPLKRRKGKLMAALARAVSRSGGSVTRATMSGHALQLHRVLDSVRTRIQGAAAAASTSARAPVDWAQHLLQELTDLQTAVRVSVSTAILPASMPLPPAPWMIALQDATLAEAGFELPAVLPGHTPGCAPWLDALYPGALGAGMAPALSAAALCARSALASVAIHKLTWSKGGFDALAAALAGPAPALHPSLAPPLLRSAADAERLLSDKGVAALEQLALGAVLRAASQLERAAWTPCVPAGSTVAAHGWHWLLAGAQLGTGASQLVAIAATLKSLRNTMAGWELPWAGPPAAADQADARSFQAPCVLSAGALANRAAVLLGTPARRVVNTFMSGAVPAPLPPAAVIDEKGGPKDGGVAPAHRRAPRPVSPGAEQPSLPAAATVQMKKGWSAARLLMLPVLLSPAYPGSACTAQVDASASMLLNAVNLRCGGKKSAHAVSPTANLAAVYTPGAQHAHSTHVHALAGASPAWAHTAAVGCAYAGSEHERRARAALLGEPAAALLLVLAASARPAALAPMLNSLLWRHRASSPHAVQGSLCTGMISSVPNLAVLVNRAMASSVPAPEPGATGQSATAHLVASPARLLVAALAAPGSGVSASIPYVLAALTTALASAGAHMLEARYALLARRGQPAEALASAVSPSDAAYAQRAWASHAYLASSLLSFKAWHQQARALLSTPMADLRCTTFAAAALLRCAAAGHGVCRAGLWSLLPMSGAGADLAPQLIGNAQLASSGTKLAAGIGAGTLGQQLHTVRDWCASASGQLQQQQQQQSLQGDEARARSCTSAADSAVPAAMRQFTLACPVTLACAQVQASGGAHVPSLHEVGLAPQPKLGIFSSKAAAAAAAVEADLRKTLVVPAASAAIREAAVAACRSARVADLWAPQVSSTVAKLALGQVADLASALQSADKLPDVPLAAVAGMEWAWRGTPGAVQGVVRPASLSNLSTSAARAGSLVAFPARAPMGVMAQPDMPAWCAGSGQRAAQSSRIFMYVPGTWRAADVAQAVVQGKLPDVATEPDPASPLPELSETVPCVPAGWQSGALDALLLLVRGFVDLGSLGQAQSPAGSSAVEELGTAFITAVRSALIPAHAEQRVPLLDWRPDAPARGWLRARRPHVAVRLAEHLGMPLDQAGTAVAGQAFALLRSAHAALRNGHALVLACRAAGAAAHEVGPQPQEYGKLCAMLAYSMGALAAGHHAAMLTAVRIMALRLLERGFASGLTTDVAARAASGMPAQLLQVLQFVCSWWADTIAEQSYAAAVVDELAVDDDANPESAARGVVSAGQLHGLGNSVAQLVGAKFTGPMRPAEQLESLYIMYTAAGHPGAQAVLQPILPSIATVMQQITVAQSVRQLVLPAHRGCHGAPRERASAGVAVRPERTTRTHSTATVVAAPAAMPALAPGTKLALSDSDSLADSVPTPHSSASDSPGLAPASVASGVAVLDAAGSVAASSLAGSARVADDQASRVGSVASARSTAMLGSAQPQPQRDDGQLPSGLPSTATSPAMSPVATDGEGPASLHNAGMQWQCSGDAWVHAEYAPSALALLEVCCAVAARALGNELHVPELASSSLAMFPASAAISSSLCASLTEAASSLQDLTRAVCPIDVTPTHAPTAASAAAAKPLIRALALAVAELCGSARDPTTPDMIPAGLPWLVSTLWMLYTAANASVTIVPYDNGQVSEPLRAAAAALQTLPMIQALPHWLQAAQEASHARSVELTSMPFWVLAGAAFARTNAAGSVVAATAMSAAGRVSWTQFFAHDALLHEHRWAGLEPLALAPPGSLAVQLYSRARDMLLLTMRMQPVYTLASVPMSFAHQVAASVQALCVAMCMRQGMRGLPEPVTAEQVPASVLPPQSTAPPAAAGTLELASLEQLPPPPAAAGAPSLPNTPGATAPQDSPAAVEVSDEWSSVIVRSTPSESSPGHRETPRAASACSDSNTSSSPAPPPARSRRSHGHRRSTHRHRRSPSSSSYETASSSGGEVQWQGYAQGPAQWHGTPSTVWMQGHPGAGPAAAPPGHPVGTMYMMPAQGTAWYSSPGPAAMMPAHDPSMMLGARPVTLSAMPMPMSTGRPSVGSRRSKRDRRSIKHDKRRRAEQQQQQPRSAAVLPTISRRGGASRQSARGADDQDVWLSDSVTSVLRGRGAGHRSDSRRRGDDRGRASLSDSGEVWSTRPTAIRASSRRSHGRAARVQEARGEGVSFLDRVNAAVGAAQQATARAAPAAPGAEPDPSQSVDDPGLPIRPSTGGSIVPGMQQRSGGVSGASSSAPPSASRASREASAIPERPLSALFPPHKLSSDARSES